jgi:hypothetical protein
MPDARERDYRQRKYMRLDALVRGWAASRGLPVSAAAAAVAEALERCPDCLVVGCRSLEEMNQGIPAPVKSARRRADLERIERLVAEQRPLAALEPYVVSTDRLLASLVTRGEPVPAFLPLLLE